MYNPVVNSYCTMVILDLSELWQIAAAVKALFPISSDLCPPVGPWVVKTGKEWILKLFKPAPSNLRSLIMKRAKCYDVM